VTPTLLASKLVYVVIIHQRHKQTDRQTDDMRSQERTVHYSASRGKNQEGKTNLDLLEQEIVSSSGIS